MLYFKTWRYAQCLCNAPRYISCRNRLVPKLKYLTEPKFRAYYNSSPKHMRYKSLINIALIASSAAGVIVYFLSRCEVLGKQTDLNCKASEPVTFRTDYECVIAQSRELLQRLKDEVGAPGLVVGVSVDGETIWEEGFGYSDIENRVRCSPNTVMRIASISKSITMAAVGKLWEDGKLDLDKPVQQYVPEFPYKTFNGIPVEITCRHLVSHLGGIRHYGKRSPTSSWKADGKDSSETKREPTFDVVTHTENGKTVKEFEHKEYYIKDKYPDVRSALDLFQDDPLVSKPGTVFHYSTHGWTLISAVVENVSDEPFTTHMIKLFKKLGMKRTYLDVNDSLIYHRSRNYSKDKRGRLVNSPYVDNSYKWAGGGYLSTVGDLLKFANAMLYSLQFERASTNCSIHSGTIIGVDEIENHTSLIMKTVERNSSESCSLDLIESRNSVISINNCISPILKCGNVKLRHGYLSSETVKLMWTPVTTMSDKDSMYAMGWAVFPEKQDCEYCEIQRFFASHTGGAIGASSVLLILPKRCGAQSCLECQWKSPPKGVIVTIMTNLQEISLSKTALEIANLFDHFSCNSPHT